MRPEVERLIADLRKQLEDVVSEVLVSYVVTDEGFAALHFENGKTVVLSSNATLELLKTGEAE